MDSDNSSGSGTWIGSGLGLLLVFYIGFPALWIWPIWKVYGNSRPDWVLGLIAPFEWLANSVPPYRSWVEWGGRLLGIA